ncbi:hypothetical protein JIX56_23510 [Streptomyces sp. CA-210063]|uniref:anti-sigma factor family protein n=1 Tax=Streptomyces sp. CA-210063 TaxID=2801029 RepID=UPI00214AC733|nr:hypothetical protein [Streptomyces sp. CA-210063]UUU32625.1 hypothetical protein JIX56_23510 [Streptomyces sp. CA-210063]
MTSTTDTAGHPDVAEISDLTEGLLPPSRTSDVRQHLDECPLCADVYASLEEIRSVLGTLPGPPRMPDDVAGRIDAALAAEALLNSTADDLDSAKVTTGSSGAASDEHDAVHVSRETSPAADRPTGHSRASTGPGRPSSKRRSRRTTVLAAAFTAAALGFGTLLLQSMSGNGSGDNPSAAQSQASDSFSGVKMEKRVADLLGDTKTKDSPGRDTLGAATIPATPDSSAANPTAKRTTDVPPCIAKGIGDITTAIAAESGTYQGADAYLVLLSDSADTSRVMAYVVDASCIGKSSEPAGEVLLKQSYPRP